MTDTQLLRQLAEQTRSVAPCIAAADTLVKNAILESMAVQLERYENDIISANTKDIEQARKAGLPVHMLKRLEFGKSKIHARVRSLRKIATLSDPVNRIISHSDLSNGLVAERVGVPIGVVLMIYEARPHVSINAGAFCLKAGNAVLLRGGSEARHCNELLGKLWHEAVAEAGLDTSVIRMLQTSHAELEEMLGWVDCIDLVIPRGGRGLIENVVAHSRIPVIKHFAGVCHVYVHEAADIDSAVNIIIDSKCLMPAVCNAAETVLVDAAQTHALPRIVEALHHHGVTVRGCEATQAAVEGIQPATVDDWTTEYLDTVISVRVVENIDEAISHINTFGSHHTDTIVTGDTNAARRFTRSVDSGVVLVNASTMFCDGESLGMGAEIGISTDKIHARGPMGLEELTSYKFVISGHGHIMGQPAVSVQGNGSAIA